MNAQLLRFCSLIFALFAVASATPLPAAVPDNQIAIWFERGGARVEIPAPEGLARETSVRVRLLEPDGREVASGKSSIAAVGKTALRMEFRGGRPKFLEWLRLEYTFAARAQPARGLISVSEVRSNLFKLHAETPDSVAAGRRYRQVVLALNRVNGSPVAGVEVKADLVSDDGGNRVPAVAATNTAGLAILEWEIPADDSSTRFTAQIAGHLGDIEDKTTLDVEVESEPELIVSTDKPLYQPEQTLRARAIALTPSGEAIPGAAIQFTVRDREYDEVYLVETEATRFGISQMEWEIPANVRTGQLVVTAEIAGGRYDGGGREKLVHVSRYEVAPFEVIATPDSSYYLPGETATVAVRVQYLHGGPVKQAAIQVAREPVHWYDLSRKEYVRMPGQKLSGIADESGHAVFEIDLPKSTSSADRYVPLKISATDPTSSRTETTEHELFLVRHPISIRIAGESSLSENLAADLYVKTEYADGTPAQCYVQLKQASVLRVPGSPALNSGPSRVVANAATDKFGYGRLPAVRLPAADPTAEETFLTVTAADDQGKTGVLTIPSQERKTDRLILEPGSYSLQAGEPLRLKIRSARQTARVMLLVSNGKQLLTAAEAELVEGGAEVDFPFRDDFTGELHIVARPASMDDGLLEDDLTVSYAEAGQLKIEVQLDREAYEPGEVAKAKLRVTEMDGTPVEAALGLSAIDRALEIRASQQHEWIWRAWLNDLQRHTPGEQQEGMDEELVAAFVGRQPTSYDPAVDFYFSPDFESLSEAFTEPLREASRPVVEALDRRLAETGGHLFADSDLGELTDDEGNPIGDLFDPWGSRLEMEFELEDSIQALVVKSPGPDREPDTDDDLVLVPILWPFFEHGSSIEAALRAAEHFPATQDEVNTALRAAGIDPDGLIDPWGEPYYVEFQRTRFRTSHLKVTYYPEQPWPTAEPPDLGVEERTVIFVKTLGPDGRKSKYNTSVASFVEPTSTALELAPGEPAGAPAGTAGTGISGTVFDETWARIPRAQITVVNQETSTAYMTVANGIGMFLIDRLLPGTYTVQVQLMGFRSLLVESVPVREGQFTPVDAYLEVGRVSETITLEASPARLNTSSAMVVGEAASHKYAPPPPPPPPGPEPRVRDKFLESMLWLPLAETDAAGEALIDIPLADNITTWNFRTLASTVRGQVTLASKELRVFQPFFLDHDPPPILTQGDEITLPVLVRNYTSSTQDVGVEMHEAEWFEILSEPRARTEVEPDGARAVNFRLRATGIGKSGPNRVSALAAEVSDAVERKVEVRPFGHLKSATINRLLSDSSHIEFEVPTESLQGTLVGRIRIYPDMNAHAFSAVEDLLSRPYGCAEQTISSTWPNLIVLAYLDSEGAPANAELRAKALANVQRGYSRLSGYRNATGGYAYFHGGKSDLAVSAYAVEFLELAHRYVLETDDSLAKTREWLAWQTRLGFRDTEHSLQALNILPTLARDEAHRETAAKTAAKFWPLLDASNNSYYLAQGLLVSLELGDPDQARTLTERLLSLARRQAGRTSWTTRERTPFHSWGRAEAIETTSLVIKALIKATERGVADREAALQASERAMYYLLTEKDRYGVWFSTQATVKALDALLAYRGFTESREPAKILGISVNGRPAEIDTSPGRPWIEASLDGLLKRGANVVEIASEGEDRLVPVQVSGDFYVPWSDSSRAAAPVALKVAFDKTEARVGDRISCTFSVQRLNPLSAGMILAEIGLPPGAEIEPGSLQHIYGRSIDRFEVQPDRLVVYLWPSRGEGSDITFSFRPRFAMEAHSAPSRAYDYYNGEIEAVAEPVKFVVEANP